MKLLWLMGAQPQEEKDYSHLYLIRIYLCIMTIKEHKI